MDNPRGVFSRRASRRTSVRTRLRRSEPFKLIQVDCRRVRLPWLCSRVTARSNAACSKALCESERSNLRTGAPAISAYEVYGALEGCGSLADSLLKENQLERAAKINERICLAKQQRSTDEGDSSDRSSIRKACERGASLFPRDRIVRCREAVRGSALRVSQRRDLGRRRSRGVDWVQQQGHSRYPVRSVERFLLR